MTFRKSELKRPLTNRRADWVADLIRDMPMPDFATRKAAVSHIADRLLAMNVNIDRRRFMARSGAGIKAEELSDPFDPGLSRADYYAERGRRACRDLMVMKPDDARRSNRQWDSVRCAMLILTDETLTP